MSKLSFKCGDRRFKAGPALAAYLGVFVTILGIGLGGAALAAEKPNFIVIFADDLGYGDLGCYGSTVFKTPNLNRMAEEGIRLTDFYTTFPACAPSRTSLLTGQYHFRSGMFSNPAPDGPPNSGIDDRGIPDEAWLLPEALKTEGYATCMIGKWHLGHKPRFYPRKHGFDEYFGILYSNDMRPVELWENETVVEYPVVQATITRRYTERAIDFIERHREEPFLLYLPHAMPHKPLAVSPDFYTPETREDLYADVLSELDWSVGEVLKKVKESGLEENTLVIFTSDNGPWFGGSTGGLRGMKASTWDGGYKIPFIARWPGKIPAGQESGAPCSTIDVMPTLCELAGVTEPEGHKFDGLSLWKLLTGEGLGSPHEALFCLGGNQLATVRSGRWKLHVKEPRTPYERFGPDWVDPRAPDGVTILAPYEQARPEQFPGNPNGVKSKAGLLFDLEADPQEQVDLSAERPDVVERLQKLYDAMNAEVEAARVKYGEK